MPIAMPMCAAFSAGTSLTPSPVTATTCLLLLQRLDDAQLLLGDDAREDDFRVIQRQLQLRDRAAPQLLAGDDRWIVRLHQTDLARDRRGRPRMIAGHHDDLDPGFSAFPERFRHLRPGRVFQPDEPDEDQILLETLPLVIESQVSVGERKDPQAPLRHRLLRLRDLSTLRHCRAVEPHRRSDMCRHSGSTVSGAPLQYSARPSGVRCTVRQTHPVGVERNLVQPRIERNARR